MNLSKIVILACAGLVLGGVAYRPAEAGISVNGISVNGISVNGISVNGISANGISANGISANGLATNGTRLNGSDEAFDFGNVAVRGSVSLADGEVLPIADRRTDAR